MKRAGALLAVALLVSLVAVPGVAAAQETRTGSTVVVEEDETVGDLIVVGALAQVPYVGPVVSGFVTLL
jgi:putative cell wall-binding protein